MRLRAGLTQRQFADALGVKQQFVSQMERGKRPVPPWRFEEALMLDPDLGIELELVEARNQPMPRGPYRTRDGHRS